MCTQNECLWTVKAAHSSIPVQSELSYNFGGRWTASKGIVKELREICVAYLLAYKKRSGCSCLQPKDAESPLQ
jgi:hypothetical protein